MTRDELTQLTKPFRPSLIRDNPTGWGSYVPHSQYVERLLYTLGGFDFEIVEVLRGRAPGRKGEPDLEHVVVGCLARLQVVIDGERRTITEVGDCEMPSNWPHDGARLKDAASDSLKRCSARLGLGLHLYSGTEFRLHDALVKAAETDQVEPFEVEAADD